MLAFVNLFWCSDSSNLCSGNMSRSFWQEVLFLPMSKVWYLQRTLSKCNTVSKTGLIIFLQPYLSSSSLPVSAPAVTGDSCPRQKLLRHCGHVSLSHLANPWANCPRSQQKLHLTPRSSRCHPCHPPSIGAC